MSEKPSFEAVVNPGGTVTVILRQAGVPCEDSGYTVPEAFVVVPRAELAEGLSRLLTGEASVHAGEGLPAGRCCLVHWIDAKVELPDADRTVLVNCVVGDDPVWLGYWDGETWRLADGGDLGKHGVAYWAEMPVEPHGRGM